MVECVGLENRYTRKGIEGSNPSLSALETRPAASRRAFFIYGESTRLPQPTVARLWQSPGTIRYDEKSAEFVPPAPDA